MSQVRKDWCRNSEWTLPAREKFFLRLSSVRDPAKYLRRKADHLVDNNPEAACDLLVMAAEQARRLQDRRDALRGLARASARCRRMPQAHDAWRAALACRSVTDPGVQIAVEYAAFITGHQQVDRYDDAASLLTGLDERLLDPVQRFFFHAARAILADANADPEQARLDAGSALTAHRRFADTPRQFPEAALTGDTATGLYARLQILAGRTLAG
ncbi:MAG: hypothetical protein ACOY3X_07020 [Pseudomonadota bacterium]